MISKLQKNIALLRDMLPEQVVRGGKHAGGGGDEDEKEGGTFQSVL